MNNSNMASIGFDVCTALRDFAATKIAQRNGAFYSRWGGFDCKRADEIDGAEKPDGKPLLTFQVQRRNRKTVGRSRDESVRVDFIVEAHVLADADGGGLSESKDDVAADDVLSDDLEIVLDNNEARLALGALGFQGLQAGERRESVRNGLHTNITLIMFGVNVKNTTAEA